MTKAELLELIKDFPDNAPVTVTINRAISPNWTIAPCVSVAYISDILYVEGEKKQILYIEGQLGEKRNDDYFIETNY